LKKEIREKDSHIAHLQKKSAIIDEKVSTSQPQDPLKYLKNEDINLASTQLIVHNDMLQFDDVSKILQLVDDELPHHKLEMNKSTLMSDDNETEDATTVQMEYLIMRPSGKEKNVLLKFEDDLKTTGRKVISGLCELKPRRKADIGIQFDYLTTLSDNLYSLRDAKVAGKMVFCVEGNNPQSRNWEGYGLEIGVSKGTMLASETADIAVAALVGGHFVFPKNTQLVSAVYAIIVSKPLLEPLRLAMQHCVKISRSSQTKQLKFGIAPMTTAPCQFELVEGGEFSVDSFYGFIYRQEFCYCAIFAYMNGDQPDGINGDQPNGVNGDQPNGVNEVNGDDLDDTNEDQNQSNATIRDHITPTDMVYTGIMFYEDFKNLVTFAATKSLDVLEKYIENKHPYADIGQQVDFGFKTHSRFIELIFDDNNKEEYFGWKIQPHLSDTKAKNNVRLLQANIDKYGTENYIIPPKCIISVKASNEPNIKPVPELHYGILLEGIDPPGYTIFIHKDLKTLNTVKPPRAQVTFGTSERPKKLDLLQLLSPISHKWEMIGTDLDVDEDFIEGLNQNLNDNMLRLSAVLQAWLNRDIEISWDKIIQVVEGPLVNNQALANSIRECLIH
jgi:hypothetical protein